MLSQCPCSGNGGLNPVILLVIFAGLWLLFNWIKTLIKSKGVSFMNKTVKILIVIVLIAAVGIVIAVKQKEKNMNLKPVVVTESKSAATQGEPEKISSDSNNPPVMTVEVVEPVKKLPRLVDLGADKCIPCKMMKPILEELDAEYKGKLQVDFYDVWKDPAPGQQYGIRVIPTQIFLNPDGKELFRHEGFFSKEDILAKWKKLGFELKKKD
jgi:thioredoxin 1